MLGSIQTHVMLAGNRKRLLQLLGGDVDFASHPVQVGEVVQGHHHRFRRVDGAGGGQTGLEGGDGQIVVAPFRGEGGDVPQLECLGLAIAQFSRELQRQLAHLAGVVHVRLVPGQN